MKKTILLLFTLFLTVYGVSAQETLRVLCIGNSFTYVSDTHLKMKEIAESQGHKMDVNAVYVGGYTFNRHLHDLKTLQAIEAGKYDCVFLQDQSQMPAHYAQDPIRWRLAALDAQELAERVRMFSPDARVWLEQTWSYAKDNFGGFGSWESFDHFQAKGASLIAKLIHTSVSPIADAFALCRAERPDIHLYNDDQHHQSDYGAYLKSCVNYLLIYGEKFTPSASACGLNAEYCKYLRTIAEKVVLK